MRVIELVLIGLVAGWLAATILGVRRRYGIIGYIAVGIAGAIGGHFAFVALQLPYVHVLYRLVAALLGALVLILLLRLFRGR